jgi:cell division protein FtsB
MGLSMSFARSLNRRGRAAVPPLVFLLLVAYFLWQATQGEHGLKAYAQRLQDLKGAQAELDQAQAEQAAWERRVASLRTGRLDPDALDERARAMLNLSDPNDIILLYGTGQKLF